MPSASPLGKRLKNAPRVFRIIKRIKEREVGKKSPHILMLETFKVGFISGIVLGALAGIGIVGKHTLAPQLEWIKKSIETFGLKYTFSPLRIGMYVGIGFIDGVFLTLSGVAGGVVGGFLGSLVGSPTLYMVMSGIYKVEPTISAMIGTLKHVMRHTHSFGSS